MKCMRVLISAILTACAPYQSRSPGAIESAKRATIVAEDVARARGTLIADRLDSLLANVLSARGTITEGKFGSTVSITNDADISFEALLQIPHGASRFVECLGWNKRSGTSWNEVRLLVGAVCGHLLAATPYVQARLTQIGKSVELFGAFNYHNPSIEELRAAQAAWRAQLRREPD